MLWKRRLQRTRNVPPSSYPFGLRAWPTANQEYESAIEVIAGAVMDLTLHELSDLHTRDDVRRTPQVHAIRNATELNGNIEEFMYLVAELLLDAQEHLNKAETRPCQTASAFVALAKQKETGV
jgi:hypothetical protein